MRKIPSITSLRALEAAGRLQSFTRAAEELNLTQSAISRQIHGLEDQLGARLFELVRQRIVLTQVGRRYVEEIRPLLANLEVSSQRVTALSEGRELVEAAVPPTFCSRWLIPRLHRFYAENPKASINFTSKLGRFNFDSEPFDVAIHRGRADWPDTRMDHLLNERLIAACSPQFREKYKIDSDARLSASPLLHLSTRYATWPYWHDRYSLPAENAYRGTQYDQWSMLIDAAVAGLGAALVPDILVQEELRSGRLVQVSDNAIDAPTGYLVAVPQSRPTAPMTRKFCDWLLKEADESSAALAVATGKDR